MATWTLPNGWPTDFRAGQDTFDLHGEEPPVCNSQRSCEPAAMPEPILRLFPQRRSHSRSKKQEQGLISMNWLWCWLTQNAFDQKELNQDIPNLLPIYHLFSPPSAFQHTPFPSPRSSGLSTVFWPFQGLILLRPEQGWGNTLGRVFLSCSAIRREQQPSP